MIRKTKTIKTSDLRGGKGLASINPLLEENEKFSEVTFLGVIELAPQASIGYHEHSTNSETYYILQGTGIFEEKEGLKTPVERGDFCHIESGYWHGIENTGKNTLVILAVVSDNGLIIK